MPYWIKFAKCALNSEPLRFRWTLRRLLLFGPSSRRSKSSIACRIELAAIRHRQDVVFSVEVGTVRLLDQR